MAFRKMDDRVNDGVPYNFTAPPEVVEYFENIGVARRTSGARLRAHLRTQEPPA